ncbi:unnamed protein product [Parnassius apollo]|uniref:(apollo) hypothetical protein n=1 Tax=Parnassius apollo TaxID=110799 RepID=A0A8S3X0V1_PARAO|nr:unnamed protein product [Parnassius apollo]
MSGTYLHTNPPPYGYGSPAPHVAATVSRAHEYNSKSEDSETKMNNYDAQVENLNDFPKEGITGNFNPSIAWLFAQIFVIKNFKAIVTCMDKIINFIKKSNSDIMSKESKLSMLNQYNKEWFSKLVNRVDGEDYIPTSPGFLMGMLNAASTTVGLIAICGIDIPNTITKSLRSSDDSMTVFVADTIQALATLIGLTYSVYRLFGINPNKEKTILFPESYGEYTSWYQDGDFVGQYGVETSSLKPMGKNPQDDFNPKNDIRECNFSS